MTQVEQRHRDAAANLLAQAHAGLGADETALESDPRISRVRADASVVARLLAQRDRLTKALGGVRNLLKSGEVRMEATGVAYLICESVFAEADAALSEIEEETR